MAFQREFLGGRGDPRRFALFPLLSNPHFDSLRGEPLTGNLLTKPTGAMIHS